MTVIELITTAQSRIDAVRKSQYIPFDIMSSCEAQYLDEALKLLDDAINQINIEKDDRMAKIKELRCKYAEVDCPSEFTIREKDFWGLV